MVQSTPNKHCSCRTFTFRPLASRCFSLLAVLLGSFSSGALAADAAIDFDSRLQPMSGFGASTAWAGATMPDDMIKELFSAEEGCGLSLVRMRIAPDGTTGEHEIAIAKKAQEYGAAVWAAPWSPSPQWKDSKSATNGGVLLKAHYQDWADLLAKYAKNMEEKGVRLKFLSAQNEPDFTAKWESCRWTPEEMASFIGDNLGPALEKAGVKTGIISGEPVGWTGAQAYGDAILENPKALRYVNIIPTHGYSGQPTADKKFPYMKPQLAGKEFWETEVTINDVTLIGYNKNIHNHIVNGPVSAWHFWWFLHGGSLGNGSSSGLIMGGKVSHRVFGMGNYSRFVRKGAFRVKADDNPSAGIFVTAYRHDSLGQMSIVVINENASATQQKFNFKGMSFPELTPYETNDTDKLVKRTSVTAGASVTYAFPPKSIVTLVGKYTAQPISIHQGDRAHGMGNIAWPLHMTFGYPRMMIFEVARSGNYSLQIFGMDGASFGKSAGRGPSQAKITLPTAARGVGFLRFTDSEGTYCKPMLLRE